MSRWTTALAALMSGVLLGSTGCVFTSGPNCSDACDKALACEDLDKTFALNCAPYGACYGTFAECAFCIEGSTCEQLIAGECDPVCTPQQQP